MRWKTKVPLTPLHNEKRVVTRFIWWPTALPCDHIGLQTRWLEVCRIEQRYRSGIGSGWYDEKWAN